MLILHKVDATKDWKNSIILTQFVNCTMVLFVIQKITLVFNVVVPPMFNVPSGEGCMYRCNSELNF